jgi:hypothetical protein
MRAWRLSLAHDVFISYSSADKTAADATCAIMEAAGIRCWIAPRDVVPGGEYADAIITAIESSHVLVLIFSAHANTSNHIRREIERAISHDIVIVPVRIDEAEPRQSLEYFLAGIHWLDALTPPLEGHLRRLAEEVKHLLARRAEAAREARRQRRVGGELLPGEYEFNRIREEQESEPAAPWPSWLGNPREASPYTARVTQYVYLSPTKINLVYAQMPKSLLERLRSILWHLTDEGFEVSEQQDPLTPPPQKRRFYSPQPSSGPFTPSKYLIDRAKLVSRYILSHEDVGTLASPKRYIYGVLSMRHGIVSGGRHIAFFGQKFSTNRSIALIGSSASVIGNSEVYNTNHTTLFYQTGFLHQKIYDNDFVNLGKATIYWDAFHGSLHSIPRATDVYEFLAISLHREAKLLVATPIYVALSDDHALPAMNS